MIDVFSEECLPLKDAAKEIPGRPHTSTVIRWTTRGCRGVRLQTVLVGGVRFTSRQAITRFINATTAAADGRAPEPSGTMARQRQGEIVRAEQETDQAGI